MKRLNGKLNSRKGFSLTELLVAVLILSMVSAVVAGGIPVARDAFKKVTLAANAQVMLSTAISALRNELCGASEVKVEDDEVEYYSPAIQNYSKIKKDSKDIQVVLFSQNGDGAKTHKLVSDKAGDDDKLHVTYSKVQKKTGTNNIIQFIGLRVEDQDGTPRAELEGEENSILEIRMIAA